MLSYPICAYGHVFRSFLRLKQAFNLVPFAFAFWRRGAAPVPLIPHVGALQIPLSCLCLRSLLLRSENGVVHRYLSLHISHAFVAEADFAQDKQAGRRRIEFIQEWQRSVGVLLSLGKVSDP